MTIGGAGRRIQQKITEENFKKVSPKEFKM